MAGENPQTLLKENVQGLVTTLREDIFTASDEQADIFAVEFFFSQMSPDVLSGHIIKHILPHKEQISRRDLQFFIQNEGLFKGLPAAKTRYYSQLIASGERLTPDDEQVVWEYLDLFVGLAERIKKNK